MDFLQGLNEQQRLAVQHVDGPLLILAGAGSGKTRVITHRIAHLIEAHKIHPASILAVTFTNKAADEMRQRVASLLRESDPKRLPRLSTFHSFGVRLLRRDGERLADIRPGFTRTFNIYDDDDQLAVVKAIFRGMGLDDKNFMPYRAALSALSHAKNHQQSPDDMQRDATDPRLSRLAVVYEQYEVALRRANALDFDDLLLESVRLLRHDTVTRDAWGQRLNFVMVDEYQDTNRSQYELMRLLSDSRGNVGVVGDEDQSIYSWRGADIKNILDFNRDYPNAVTIRLEQNYRSTKNILEAASALVSHNTQRLGKWLWTDSGAGSRVGLYQAFDAENEALFIADSIERILGDDPGASVAVLYRTNFQSRQIEEALRRYSRKYTIVGGFSFYQRAEIKDILSYVRAAIHPHDSVSMLRIINTPARGIGKTTSEQIERYALETGTSVWSAIERMLDERQLGTRAESALASFRGLIHELHQAAPIETVDRLINIVVDRSGYRRMLESDPSPESATRLENIAELINAASEARERGETVSDFMDHAALVSDADQVDEKAQVLLLTMHNAKGLEFPYVFIAGLEEGLFPHSRAIRGESDLEEERRLCYVAMTRARKRLILAWARQRRRFGGGAPEPSIRSRFLGEVPPQLIEKLNEPGSSSYMVDLTAESHEVRESARRNAFTGKTYNSLEAIRGYFGERGISPPALVKPEPKPPSKPPVPPAPKKKVVVGGVIDHPRYGRGTILRREGEGEDAKLTISFPGYGLKKIVAKYAGLKLD